MENHRNPQTTTFRLLCHVMNIGGVIGRSGSIVKTLEQQTHVKIRVEEPVPDCIERVINVIGSSYPSKTISLDDRKEEESSSSYIVSPAQEGLLRVFNRVLEVEAEKDGEIGNDAVSCCRLLADVSQIGIVLGKGGKNASSVGRESGTNVRVLRREQTPACATPNEQLIRITGGASSVKKALFAISCCLQDHPPVDKASMGVNKTFKMAPLPQEDFRDPHIEFFPDLKSSVPPVPGDNANSASGDHSVSTSVGEQGAEQEVVFRLLCSTSKVGGVIGKGGTIVRTLQNESGAFINFGPSVNGCDERIVIFSALETPTSSYSPAQNAVVRVFARYVEVGFSISKRLGSGKSGGETVTARLLLSSDQASCFKGENDDSLSEIKEVINAEIELLRGDCVPSCTSQDDEILQITGKYKNVQSALLQVTGRLRENCFPSTVLSGAGARNYHSYPIPDINHHKRIGKTNSSGSNNSVGHYSSFNQERITRGLNYLGISDIYRGPHSARLQHSQHANGGHMNGFSHGERYLAEGPELGSANGPVGKTTEEVVVPENIFCCVCGKDGSNLNLMRQISGAQVEVRDPSPGKSEGAVIISGSRDQILAARSLLQAFILTAH